MTDVGGLNSASEAAAWQGVRDAASREGCTKAELVTSSQPTDYRANLQAATDQHADLVIAGSFLLSDAIIAAAITNPSTHFVLVDPLVPLAGRPNLTIVSLRDDQAGFLAGALAGFLTRSGVVGGVYGLDDQHDRGYRLGFEDGARYANPSVIVLGSFQGAQDGPPYANPQWGSARAHAFLRQGADVIFGSGDLTAQGGLTAAAEAGKACITVAFSTDPALPCLVGTVRLRLDRAVAQVVTEATAGGWQGGEHASGVADGAIEVVLSSRASNLQRRMQATDAFLASRED